MICARVVMNNDPRDVEIDGTMLEEVWSLGTDSQGRIVLEGLDAAYDHVKLTAEFGRTIEIYH